LIERTSRHGAAVDDPPRAHVAPGWVLMRVGLAVRL
jgi:hypothetical protein